MSKEDRKMLKEYIKMFNAREPHDFFAEWGTIGREQVQAIENMLREDEANKKRIEELENVILKDYISKFIIKETLEELQAEYKIALEENSIKAFILKCKIEGLQELLKYGGN